MQTKLCRTCANQLPSQALFCNRCGSAVTEANEQTWVEGQQPGEIQFVVSDPATMPTSPILFSPEAEGDMLPPVFSSQDHALIQDGEEDPAPLARTRQEREAIAALPTTHLKDDDDDDDRVLLIAAAAAAAPGIQQHRPAEELRGPHQQPQQARAPHRKPEEIRIPHTRPPEREGKHKQPGKASGILIGAIVIALVGLLITLLTQLPGGQKKTLTPTAVVTGQASALSVLQAGNAFPGGAITLHGEHFLPGGTVIFYAQNASLVSTIHATGPTKRQHRNSLALLAPEQVASVNATTPSTIVNSDGKFDATFPIPTDWQPDHRYTIQASEQQNGRSATAMVTVTVQKAPQVNPTARPTATPTTTAPSQPTVVAPTPTTAPPPIQRQLTANGTGQGSAMATGTVTIAGTSAQGTLQFAAQNTTATLKNGDTFVNTLSPNVTMVLDLTAPVTVPVYQSVTVPAHVKEAGAIGNEIQAYSPTGASTNNAFLAYYNGITCGGEFPACITITSATAFTGGKDPQTNVAIAQADIDAASNQAQMGAVNAATQSLQNQLQGNEHFVDSPQCVVNTTNVDHKVGDQARAVNVAEAVSCTVIAST